MLDNMRLYGTILLAIQAAVVYVGVKYVNRFGSVLFFWTGCLLQS